MILRCDDCYMFVAKINNDIYDIYTTTMNRCLNFSKFKASIGKNV